MPSLADIPIIPYINDGSEEPDPHAKIRELRATAPLARTTLGMIVALRHRHMELITSDATRQIETEGRALEGLLEGPIFDFTRSGMLFANGDVHQRRRGPVAKTFAFKLMEGMRPKTAELAAEMIRERLGKGPFEFVDEYAAQIPARIIADILGIPRSDLPIFMKWIADTAESLGFVAPDRRAHLEASLTAFNDYVGGLLDDRRANPRDDFLTAYANATARDEQLSELEVRTQILGLILAGSDTTRGSISLTLANLLARPEQWQAFCADPDGLKRAVVDEGLRFEPVVSGIPRVPVRDLEIDGYVVPAGVPIAISLLAALRDPDVYENPDAFDIFRKDHPKWHPMFGGGAHRCLGEALARAEMEESLAMIAKLAPNSRLIGGVPGLKPGAIRQVAPMQVAFEA